MRSNHLLITCEHAGNKLPEAYKYLFHGHQDVLKTHRGFDPGAYELSKKIASSFNAPLFFHDISRLLVEVNRSLDHPQLFSAFSIQLNPIVKNYLIEHYYLPYRSKVETHVKNHVSKHHIIHLSVHSFTPIWDGKERKVDIGLLFDIDKPEEYNFCHSWKHNLETGNTALKVLFNEPYNGADDGFTTYLRQAFAPNCYLGIELEVSQKLLINKSIKPLANLLIKSLQKSIDLKNSTIK